MLPTSDYPDANSMRENFGNATKNLIASQLKINDDSAAKAVEGGDPERICLFPAKILCLSFCMFGN